MEANLTQIAGREFIALGPLSLAPNKEDDDTATPCEVNRSPALSGSVVSSPNKELFNEGSNDIREGRLFALELILLGMAMAKDGDREVILEELEDDSMSSEKVKACMKAVRTKDADDISTARIALDGLGLKVEGSVRDALIRRVNLANARRKLQRSLFDVSVTPNADIEAAVETVTQMAKKYDLMKDRYEEQPRRLSLMIRQARRWFEEGKEESWIDMGAVTHSDAASKFAERRTYSGVVETRDKAGGVIFKHFVEPVTTYRVLSYRATNELRREQRNDGGHLCFQMHPASLRY